MKEYNLASDGTTPSFINLASTKFENVFEAAQEYHSRGFIITPLSGKTPILEGWQKCKLSEEELPHCFGDGQNIGIVLGGASGVGEVDLDNPLAVVAADCLLPESVKSGREKNPYSHWWYCCDPIPTSKPYSLTKIMAEQLGLEDVGTMLVELRSDGRQTMVAPSIHPEDGDQYVWHSGEILKVDGNELEELVREVAIATLLALHWPEGSRQRFAQCAAGYLGRHVKHERVQAILEAAIAAAEDEEHHKRGQAVRDTLRKLSEGQEAVTGGPTLEELAPGVAGLIAKWCEWRLAEEERKGGEHKNGGPVGGGEKDEKPTHDELRDQWEERNPGHAYGLGEWMRYERGVFRPVFRDLVKRQIMETLEAAKSDGVKPTSWLLDSVLELARVKLAVPDEEWDADSDILVCGNGTLHIPTGELLPHSPEHRATSGVPYDYDEQAVAQTWERFLRDFVDPETARFLQEFAGYALTTDVSHEIALWLCGPPGGGRSTFIAGLEAMLGEKVGTLGLGEIERSRFALADVPGKTLLTATEQPAGYVKISHVVNALISGDKQKVEKKFKNAFDMYPKAKLLWAMNDVPRVPSANDGLFRRVKVLEIEPIPEGGRDPSVKEAIKGEGAGILVWALKGLRRLRAREHFEIPKSVQNATDEFKLTNDVPAMFIAEACITTNADSCKEQAQKLYEAYRHWCRINGHQPLSSTKVAGEWIRLGFKKTSTSGRAYYRGVKVDEGWITAQDGLSRS